MSPLDGLGRGIVTQEDKLTPPLCSPGHAKARSGSATPGNENNRYIMFPSPGLVVEASEPDGSGICAEPPVMATATYRGRGESALVARKGSSPSPDRQHRRGHHRIDAGVRHRGVRALAGDDDLEDVE